MTAKRCVIFTATLLLMAAAASAQTGPVITSVSPDAIYVNSAATTLTLTGTGFAAGDLVCVEENGCAYLADTVVSSTDLTIPIPAGYFAYSGTYYLYIISPSDYYSNSIAFYVENLAPSISSFSPVSFERASSPGPITISGSFMAGATVQWNGKSLATTFISPTELQFTPAKSDLATAGIVPITVTNPAPGVASLPFDFDVTYKATVATVNLPVNDMVYDPYAQLIYASVPSSYGPNGNSIAVINPKNGKITAYHYAGSEPHQLALSPDSQYLYVGLNGNGSVQRLILPNFTPDIDVSLGSGYYGGPNVANSLQVSPASDHNWAVSTGTTSCCYDYATYFYTDATQLADSITNNSNIGQIVYASASTLYAYGNNTLTSVSVNSAGGTVGTIWSYLVEGSAIAYASGLVYGNQGEAFNPATALLLGTYDFGNGQCCDYSYPTILADAPFNRMLALGTTPFFSSLGITAYSLNEFTPQGVADVSQFSGDETSNLIFWGSDGVAFATQIQNNPSQVVLVTSSDLVTPAGSTKNPVPAPTSLSPASVTHGAWNTLVTINGSNFAPGASVTWNGAALNAAFVSSTQLSLYVPYTDLASAGTASVVVKNPAPKGGKAAALTFTIN
jgi:hypothetical protein